MLQQDKKQLLIGESSNFLQVLEHASQIAPLHKPVLLVGERGTGKELIAERVHFLSGRWDQAFIKINCATFNENLLESELFGHEAGAFTGANKRHIGRFERADGGSLFLDELASTSTAVQEKILRVIEYGEFERLGGSQMHKINIRIIGATNFDLPGLAKQGNFREDLLDRLAFDVITLPPLRLRGEDIPLLAEYFALNMCSELDWTFFPGFTAKAMETLINYDWPGNVRELKNVVERNVYRHQNEDKPVDNILLDPFDSPYRITSISESDEDISDEANNTKNIPVEYPISIKDLVKDYEVNLIKQSLDHAQYNQRKAARLLGLSYDQLRGFIRKYGLVQSSG